MGSSTTDIRRPIQSVYKKRILTLVHKLKTFSLQQMVDESDVPP